jgi:AraC-like DNA-binding protein
MTTQLEITPATAPPASAIEPPSVGLPERVTAPMTALPNAPLVDRVRTAVEHELETASPSVASVANTLGTSARTLQRRLGAHGLSFRDVLEAVREQRARAYLAGHDLSISEIAERLGYAEVSAFLRAFKRWTGTTPGRVRAAMATA